MSAFKEDAAKESFFEFKRTTRTPEAEDYVIFTNTEGAGTEVAGGQIRVGHFVLFLTDGELGQPRYYGHLHVEADWTDDALDHLVGEVEDRFVDQPPSGRQNFFLWVYRSELRGEWADTITDDRHRGLWGLFNQVEETQEKVEQVPDKVEEPLSELIEENYTAIEEIIESDADEETKRREISKRLRVGLEKMLPTVMMEYESTE